MRSFQDLTFSTRIQYGIPRDSQRDENWKCLTGKKTLSSFYWNSWGPFRTSLFPPGSSMGSQGAAKGKKTENVWQVKNLIKFLLKFMNSYQDLNLPKSVDLYTINPSVIFVIPNDSFELRVEDGHPSWILVEKVRSRKDFVKFAKNLQGSCHLSSIFLVGRFGCPLGSHPGSWWEEWCPEKTS